MPYPFADKEYLTAPNLNAAFAAEISTRIAAIAAETSVRAAAISAEALLRAAGDTAEATARGSAITTAIAALLPLNVRTLGAAGDGVTDDTAAIQGAINMASAAGGGVVFFPPGTYLISSTLGVARSGVRLIGSGRDTNHDYTPSWPSNANTAPVTALLWGGANGGTMVSVQPAGDVDNGGGLGGNGVLAMNLFAGVYPFSSVAAFGVLVAGCRGGEYDLFGLEFSGAALCFTALNRSSAWQNSSMFNSVRYLGARNISTAGGALRMNGVTGCGNAFNNTFDIIDALYSGGAAVDLWSCDNNIFKQVRLQRVSGHGIGVYFHAGAQYDMPARANLFQLLSPGAGGVYSEFGAFPAFENKILFYDPDENGAPAVPLIGTGSTLFWSSTKRSGACNFQAAMPGAQTIPSGAWTKVAFSAVLFDEATWFDTGSQSWKPRYPGTFLFTAAVSISLAAASGTAQLRLIQNGGAGAVLRVAHTTSAVATNSLLVSGLIGLNGTSDYVEVDVFQDSGAAATLVANSDAAYFQGSRVA